MIFWRTAKWTRTKMTTSTTAATTMPMIHPFVTPFQQSVAAASIGLCIGVFGRKNRQPKAEKLNSGDNNDKQLRRQWRHVKATICDGIAGRAELAMQCNVMYDSMCVCVRIIKKKRREKWWNSSRFAVETPFALFNSSSMNPTLTWNNSPILDF